MSRQLAEVRAWRVAGKSAPQTQRGMGAEFEEIIKYNLRRVARANARRSPQPRAVVDVLAPQKHVPAVGCLADYGVGQVAQADEVSRVGGLSGGENKENDSRRNR